MERANVAIELLQTERDACMAHAHEYTRRASNELDRVKAIDEELAALRQPSEVPA